MKTKQKVYTGSTKILYKTPEEHTLIMAFTDYFKTEDGNILNISGKGALNNNLSSFIMHKLDMIGIENHFIDKLNMREQLIQLVEVFPVQASVSIIACGRYVTEFGIEEGYVFDHPVIDFKIKNSILRYPVVNEHQILSFDWLSYDDIKQVKKQTIRVFDFLTGFFAAAGIRLIECTLEFGKVYDGEEFVVMIVDEISIDNCKLWDMNTNEKLGIEALRDNPENATEMCKNIMSRISGIISDYN
ncbi:MAG: phosphoribosylaminoimidazolesuccinocarboxamide synthase [Rickettsiaceae bacterium]|nr:MAG: phosphoribosylaminoimidazolesuccinocarboxamide synthase [Rickettsiaceae bacterium]